jgi:hypothetical protein
MRILRFLNISSGALAGSAELPSGTRATVPLMRSHGGVHKRPRATSAVVVTAAAQRARTAVDTSPTKTDEELFAELYSAPVAPVAEPPLASQPAVSPFSPSQQQQLPPQQQQQEQQQLHYQQKQQQQQQQRQQQMTMPVVSTGWLQVQGQVQPAAGVFADTPLMPQGSLVTPDQSSYRSSPQMTRTPPGGEGATPHHGLDAVAAPLQYAPSSYGQHGPYTQVPPAAEEPSTTERAVAMPVHVPAPASQDPAPQEYTWPPAAGLVPTAGHAHGAAPPGYGQPHAYVQQGYQQMNFEARDEGATLQGGAGEACCGQPPAYGVSPPSTGPVYGQPPPSYGMAGPPAQYGMPWGYMGGDVGNPHVGPGKAGAGLEHSRTTHQGPEPSWGKAAWGQQGARAYSGVPLPGHGVSQEGLVMGAQPPLPPEAPPG